VTILRIKKETNGESTNGKEIERNRQRKEATKEENGRRKRSNEKGVRVN
jgi:hypothetical protein